MKNLGTILLWLGGLGIVASVIWWWSFFSQLASAFGSRATPPVECLLSTPMECGIINQMASLGGATPYNPVVLWIAAVVFVIGVVVSVVDRRSRA